MQPNLIISFSKYKKYIIYGWFRHPVGFRRFGKYLYIGQSIRFVERLKDHNKIGQTEDVLPNDELHIWFCVDRSELNKIERVLIQKHQPKYNTIHKSKKKKEPGTTKVIDTKFTRTGRFSWHKTEKIQAEVETDSEFE